MRVVVMLFALVSCVASAADWDHDANIDAAVSELVSTFRNSGLSGMEQAVDACYAKISQADAFDDQLKRFEYCVGMDFAGFSIDKRETPADRRVDTAFFSPSNIRQRVERLETFIRDPNVGVQVIRAWARAADDALVRLKP